MTTRVVNSGQELITSGRVTAEDPQGLLVAALPFYTNVMNACIGYAMSQIVAEVDRRNQDYPTTKKLYSVNSPCNTSIAFIAADGSTPFNGAYVLTSTKTGLIPNPPIDYLTLKNNNIVGVTVGAMCDWEQHIQSVTQAMSKPKPTDPFRSFHIDPAIKAQLKVEGAHSNGMAR